MHALKIILLLYWGGLEIAHLSACVPKVTMPCLHPFVYHYALFRTPGDLHLLTLCAQNLKLPIAIQKMICLFFLEISRTKISI